MNRLTICVKAEFDDGTSELNAMTLVQDELSFDSQRLAPSFAAALEQHFGDPVMFLACVLQNLDDRWREKVPGWRNRMIDAAAEA